MWLLLGPTFLFYLALLLKVLRVNIGPSNSWYLVCFFSHPLFSPTLPHEAEHMREYWGHDLREHWEVMPVCKQSRVWVRVCVCVLVYVNMPCCLSVQINLILLSVYFFSNFYPFNLLLSLIVLLVWCPFVHLPLGEPRNVGRLVLFQGTSEYRELRKMM